MRSQYGAGPREKFPGKKDIDSLYRLSESNSPNYYDQEEDELLQQTIEIKKLLESLEKSKNEV